MAITFVELEVANPAAPDGAERVELQVDSGALNTVIPAAVLDGLRIRPLSEQTFRLANGSTIRRRRGVAVFRYGQRIGGADVVFGEAGDAALLGATTLESLGLGLDPLKRELIELQMTL